MSVSDFPEAAYLEISNLSHRYGATPALQNVSLKLRQREILALIGPSGSGKSTLLAAVAGMITPQSGKILLGGRDLLSLPPEARGLGMVFQDYALWPHMTVRENIAFPLRTRRIARAEIESRVGAALERVELRGFGERRPDELSGGQRQRIALARAVVAETKLLLLDEPLSALDPATRLSVRSQLAAILRKLDLTTIIVTHEREEAFEFADRVALLIDGAVQQEGPAQDIYERPGNLAVARFMGINVLPAEISSEGCARLDGLADSLHLQRGSEPGPVYLAIAPEQTCLVEQSGANVIAARRLRTHYRGGEYRVRVALGSGTSSCEIEARSHFAPRADVLHVHLPADRLHVLSRAP